MLVFHVETYRIVANVGRPEISKNGKTKVRLIPKVGKALTNKHLVKALKSGIECGDVNVYTGEADRRTPKEDGLKEEEDVKEREIVKKKKISGKAKRSLKKSRRKQKKTQ